MKINKEWHLRNKMPGNATMDQRISWHIDHANVCNCGRIPDTILSEMKRRNIKIPYDLVQKT